MFGTWLKQHRKVLDLTQDALADQVGCSVATVRKIETNQRRPSRQIAERLAHLLEIPANDLSTFVSFARNSGHYDTYVPLVYSDATEPDQALSKQSTNLPFWPTRLLGREQVLAATRERLLDEDVRLLTLTGAPGIGKTRLGVQIAQDLTTFADGICFVALAPLRDPELLPATIAQALGIHAATDQSFQASLKSYLRDKHMLLLLDNFEHLPAAAPLVGELLAAAPRLKLLVTSRAKLHLYGEHEFPIPPLALPDLADLTAISDLLRCYPSVALFVARARAARPDFVLTEANAPIVAEICVRLDGLPLAIELAAARSKLLNPPALLARLTSRLDLLTDGACDLPARQRTLRDMIGWSYDLLTTDEQTLLRRLGIFLGGCTIAAATAVYRDALLTNIAHGSQNGHPAPTILGQVDVLIDQSLLRQIVGVANQPRYVLLETIREYALERLTADDEIDAARQQHAAYFLRFAEEAEPQLHGSNQAEWLDRLEQDHDNLRAALAWLLECEQPELALRLAGSLVEFWAVRGYLGEGRAWLERCLVRTAEQTHARAKALYGAGMLAYRQGDYPEARARYNESLLHYRKLDDLHGSAMTLVGLGEVAIAYEELMLAHRLLEESLALCHAENNPACIARVLNTMGGLARNLGDIESARIYAEQSLALYRELEDRGNIAWLLYRLGIVAYYQGDHALERVCYAESLTIRRELGDKQGMAFVLENLGFAALNQHNYPTAQAHFVESLALYRKLGDRNGIARSLTRLGDLARAEDKLDQAAEFYEASLVLYQELVHRSDVARVLHNLGHVARRQGNYPNATQLFYESLALFHASENSSGVALCLIGLAGVASAQHQPERAAQLFGVAEDRLCIGCTHLEAVDRLDYDRIQALIHSQIDAATWAAACSTGRALSTEQAIAYAFCEELELV